MLKRLTVLWTLIRGDIKLLWFAWGHPLAPRWFKPAVAFVLLYLLSPIDLLPEALPVIGVIDDLVLVPMALAFIVKRLPATLVAQFRMRQHLSA
ncbi:MAG: DUF1232 domain-containing protein [Rubrivivax sp.]|jgi:uncharacterized membrane protein YkvA (DUF1232 family)|nr:DUF1232 domain-containing protein [Rubrivivax sp.]